MTLLSIVLSFIFAAAPVSNGNNPYASYRAKVDSAPFIVISKKDLQLVLLDDDCNVLMQTGISCAKVVGPKMKRGDHKTPEGTFKINQLLESKTLTHDFGDGKGPIKGAYGPWFLRLDVPGFIDIGIHGTHKPQSIGTRDTEGCIRLVNDDIERLKSMVKVGTPVIILPEGEALLTSCPEKSPKTLVLYYSQTGATKAVAEEIQEQTGADIKSFDVVEVYDGNYDATIKRCLAEREKGFVPTLCESPHLGA